MEKEELEDLPPPEGLLQALQVAGIPELWCGHCCPCGQAPGGRDRSGEQPGRRARLQGSCV